MLKEHKSPMCVNTLSE